MKTRIVLGILLVGLGLAASAQAQAVNARLVGFDSGKFPQVRAFVSVTDAAGHAVMQLQQDDFVVVEDGHPAKLLEVNVSQEAIHVGLVIDHSGSMSEENKMQAAQQAASAFVDELRAQDEAFVSTFSNSTELLEDFTGDHDRLQRAIGRIVASGGTAFYDAAYAGAEKFAGRRDKLKNALILLTDGLDNRQEAGGLFGLLGAGSKHSIDEAIAKAKEMNVRLYTIGLGSTADQNGLRQMAGRTGGRYYFAPRGQQLQELYQLIAEQLQKDYAVDFESPRARKDGTRRQVRIEVALPDGTKQVAEGVYVAGFLFNRFYLNWLAGLMLAALLLTMGVAPTAVSALARSRGSVSTRAGVCPRCRFANRTGARFCKNCGLALGEAAASQRQKQEPGVCLHCGRPVRAGARFCNGCGNQLH